MKDPCLSTLLQTLSEPAGETLWIVDENLAPADIRSVPARAALSAVTNRVDAYRALREPGIPAVLSDFELEDAAERFDKIVYRVSKERALVHHCINQAGIWLKQGGELCLIGQKNEGIKTHGRKAEGVLGSKSQIHKDGLCYQAFLIKEDLGEPLPCDDYPQLREIQSGDFSFVSKPGIFAWNKVDAGSRLLIQVFREHIEQFKTGGSLLDLGCGWGYLLLATSDLEFSYRVAADNNVTALRAAEENFRRAGLEVDTIASDCGSDVHRQFDVILCNPPFHQGFAVSGDLSQKFIRDCARLLAEGGTALFVVNQFIPLEKLGSSHFSTIELLAQENGFKIFAARKQSA